MSAQDQRPRFFEGQYLAAGDLSAVVDYLRGAQSRHALAEHTWGIALGLYLTERSAPGAANRQEVILQPGFATDGFGRVLAVQQATRLPESLFAGFAYSAALDDPTLPDGPVGRLVKVWLNYTETATQSAPPGFETCATDNSNSRVQEGFEFVIGDFAETAQRASVLIGTNSVDAQQALKTFDITAPELWDTSVPHQSFPGGGRPPRWLVAIGYVRWVAGQGVTGYFIDRNLPTGGLSQPDASDEINKKIRAFRRYSGVVTQNIVASDGAIVLRKRGDNPDDLHRFHQLLNSDQKLQDLSLDLVWVEGNLRVVGDANLAGGKLQWRDENGLDHGTPLYMARYGDNQVTLDNRELRAVIGKDSATNNRFVVGAEQLAAPLTGITPPLINPNLVVVSSGRVGVNTADPSAALEVKGDWDGTEDGAVRVTGTGATVRLTHNVDPYPSWRFQVGSENNSALRFGYRINTTPATWKDVLWIMRDNAVGVRSDQPRNSTPLAVRALTASANWEEIVSLEDSTGGYKWHVNLHLSGGNKNLNFAETGALNGDGRLYLQAGGNVGIGTTSPEGRLTIEGKVQSHGKLTIFSNSSDFEYTGGSDSLFIFTQNPAGVTGFLGSQVGVGSITPRNAFAVRGINQSEELVSFETPGGQTRWHLNQALVGNPRGLNFAETGVPGGDGRLFLREGGNVGIGTTSPEDKLHVAGAFLRVEGTADVNGNFVHAYLGGDGVGNDVQVGSRRSGVTNVALWNTASASRMNLYCADLNASSFNYPGIFSDEALKEDIAPIHGALGIVTKLRGVSFRWKDPDLHKPDPDFGVLAQEVEGVLPQLVSHGPRGAAVSYMSLIPLLIEAVKELKAEVDILKAELGHETPDTSKTDYPHLNQCLLEAGEWLSRLKNRLFPG